MTFSRCLFLSLIFCLTIFIISCKKGGDTNTPTGLPTISTTPVTLIGYDSAVSGGNITSEGNSSIISRGICWSINPSPTVGLATKTMDGSGTGAFTSKAKMLLTGATYYLRAYATNAQGTSYGNEISFSTRADLSKIKLQQGISLADSSLFTFDANHRIIRDVTQGNAGIYEKIETNVSRNSMGLITGYTRNWYHDLPWLDYTETAVFTIDLSNSHYLTKVITYSPASPWSYRDSIYYKYTGNYLTEIVQLTKLDAASPYDSAYKSVYLRDASTGEFIGRNPYKYLNPDWLLLNSVIFYVSLDTKINPVYSPDYGILVGFNIQDAEDDNYDWNEGSLFPNNVTVNNVSGQVANFTYAYDAHERVTIRNASGPIDNVVYFYY